MSKVPTITNCPLILIPCFLDCSHGSTLRFWASQLAQWWRILLQCKKLGFSLWVGKIPWRKKWQPTPVFLPVKSHGQRSLEGYSPRGCKRIGQNLAAKQQHCAFYSPCSKRAPQLEIQAWSLSTHVDRYLKCGVFPYHQAIFSHQLSVLPFNTPSLEAASDPTGERLSPIRQPLPSSNANYRANLSASDQLAMSEVPRPHLWVWLIS